MFERSEVMKENLSSIGSAVAIDGNSANDNSAHRARALNIDFPNLIAIA
jgi:hypothetical protein